MQATVYILLCADGSYYTGITRKDPATREGEHNDGLTPGYTYSRRPVKMVFCETFDRIDEAIPRERQIKGWSRKKKEALVRGDHEGLEPLSKRRGGKPKA